MGRAPGGTNRRTVGAPVATPVFAVWDTSGTDRYRVLARPVSAATRARDVPAVSSRQRAETPPAASRSPSRAGQRRCAGSREGVPVSDNEVASMPEEAVDGPLDPAAVAALTAPVPETIGDGGPELVQMLTPEGERVDNPEYASYIADLDDEDLRGFYRDHVLIRRVDAEATRAAAPGGARHLGQPARPG